MQKKKLLLLSAIVLLGTNSYGQSFDSGEYVVSENITVTSGNGHQLNAGKNETDITKVINTGDINVDGGTGVRLEKLKDSKGNNIFINKGTLTVNQKTGQGNTGIQVVKGEAINENTIIVNAGKYTSGMKASGTEAKIDNKGILKIVGDEKNTSNGMLLENGGKGTNNGIIEVSKKAASGVGVKENSEMINNGEIHIKEGGIGVNVAGEKGNFINNGTIMSSGNGSQGINISKDGEVINNNLIKVDGANATGVYVQGKSKENINSGTFINEEKGTIEVSGNGAKGIYINTDVKPNISNKGNIKVSNDGIGVFFYQDVNKNESKASFENSGIIEVSGYNSKTDVLSRGIYLNASGEAKNLSGGTIVVKKGALGVDINNKDAIFINEKDANIIVNGESAKNSKDKEVPTTGILVKTGNKNTVNNGYIEVNQISGEGAVGIQVNDGKATNNGDILVNAGKYTSGMKADGKNSTIENNGNVTIIGDGQTSNGMIAQNQGTVINNDKGIVVASGKNTSAMYAKGKGTSADKESLVENRGKIELSNNATGMKLESNGVGKNSGTIKGNGTGVNLIGGIFVNSGEIDTTNTAIQSSTVTIKENGKDKVVGTNNTVYLKNGSKVNGKIVGNTGVDILALEGNNDGKTGEYSNLNVNNYEAITVRNGDATISNATIGLGNHKDTDKYLSESNKKLDEIENGSNKSNGTLTLNNSNLVIDMNGGTSSNGNGLLNGGNVKFDGDIGLGFTSKNGERNFDIDTGLDILGLNEDKKNELKGSLTNSAIWSYNDDKTIATKNYYRDVITTSYLTAFANKVDTNKLKDGDLKNYLTQLEFSKSAEQFTKGLAQTSGGLHGYTVDIAAINSRNLVNTMKNKALTRDYLTARPLNSWYQDVIYLDNNQRLGGLMSGSYQENGILGISEKQSVKKGRLGFVYGGSKGKAKFDGGDSGEIATDNIYVGLYYNHNLSEKLALNTNFSFVYGHNSVKRRISDLNKEFISSYPTYAMGIGTSAIYTIKDDVKNKASFYAGIDVNRIMQGNINEEAERKDPTSDLVVKNTGVNEFSYYSITPSAGFMVQNTGYIFDKKYLVGADLVWETELGNIKDGKRLNMQGITDQYKVGTMERENVFSTSIFGQLDITESLALNGRYTSSISDEYDADMLTMGLTYKMDTMADTPIFGPLLSGIENTRLSSDRWSGTFALMMESEDNSDRVYYSQIDNSLGSGDYATSMLIKPKFTLSLNDKKTKWSYYFEGYYSANDFLKDTKAGEAEQKATRLHGEARWSDSYSKGRYGFNVGYRNETSDKPALSYTKGPARVERGVHQLRLTPNFSYNLGSGFRLDMKTTGIFEYNYTGLLEGQMDFLMENEHNLVYTGFMPRWQLRMGYYREDRWMDHDGIKYSSYNANSGEYVFAKGAGRYQMNQLRPSATYYFGNGDSITFALRVPLGNGAWYNSLDNNKKDSESYETRYTVNYNHVVTPGFNIFGELTFLDIKTKNTKSGDANNGKISRSYSFRPTVGFSYSF